MKIDSKKNVQPLLKPQLAVGHRGSNDIDYDNNDIFCFPYCFHLKNLHINKLILQMNLSSLYNFSKAALKYPNHQKLPITFCCEKFE